MSNELVYKVIRERLDGFGARLDTCLNNLIGQPITDTGNSNPLRRVLE